MDKMKSGEITKTSRSSSPMFVSQWSIKARRRLRISSAVKQGYKGNGYATEQQKAQEWQCSCKSWTTTVPRADCKHIVAVKLKEKILVDVTPMEAPVSLILVKPEKGHVVISEQEHEEYKKFLEARGTRKAGNQFDEEGGRQIPSP